MSNPIFSSFNQQLAAPQSNSNSLLDLMKQVKNSSNPTEMMEKMLTNNPNFQGVVDYINQNGGNAKTAFYNLAAQKGVDPNMILNLGFL